MFNKHSFAHQHYIKQQNQKTKNCGYLFFNDNKNSKFILILNFIL